MRRRGGWPGRRKGSAKSEKQILIGRRKSFILRHFLENIREWVTPLFYYCYFFPGMLDWSQSMDDVSWMERERPVILFPLFYRDVKKMEGKKSPLPSKIDAADRRVGWAGGALSNIDPESSRESEVPQKFREKRGNATGNNGRRGEKLFSVFFWKAFFVQNSWEREEKCPKKKKNS